jgi:hypothetical protein
MRLIPRYRLSHLACAIRRARVLEQYVPAHCKPSTQAEYRRSVELFRDPFFAKQRVGSVTTADVAELHGSMSHIPYQANRTLGVLSKMMNLAETWGMRDRHSNPCEDIERYPERQRERFLSPGELERLGEALTAAEVNETENHIRNGCVPDPAPDRMPSV